MAKICTTPKEFDIVSLTQGSFIGPILLKKKSH